MREAKKVETALINLNRAYLYEAMSKNDEEYIKAFNAMISVVRRLQNDS
jgi:hypothetical protein